MSDVRLDTGAQLATLLDDIVAFARRYVVMTAAQADVVALWLVHTHALDAADTTPYLSIHSAEKRSGKSRLLDVLEFLVPARPVRTANLSEAALFRLITERRPVLLMDEVDAIFGPKAKNHEDLRGLLNAGYQRGTHVPRCVGDGAKMRVVEFEAFCAKALAGIGKLPDTVADRSLPIELKRRAPDETVERFRRREVLEVAEPLRGRLAAWADDETRLAELAAARPDLPSNLDDRAQDAVEPLLAIADLAGPGWAERARRAVVELRADAQPEEADSLGVLLLADVQRSFEDLAHDRLSSADLVEALTRLEERPWGEFGAQRSPLTRRRLASMLKRYNIRSTSVWLPDGTTAKGYKREDFDDAWARYLPSDPSGPSGHSNHAGSRSLFDPSGDPRPDGSKDGSIAHEHTDLTDLTDQGQGRGGLTLEREVEELLDAGVLVRTSENGSAS